MWETFCKCWDNLVMVKMAASIAKTWLRTICYDHAFFTHIILLVSIDAFTYVYLRPSIARDNKALNENDMKYIIVHVVLIKEHTLTILHVLLQWCYMCCYNDKKHKSVMNKMKLISLSALANWCPRAFIRETGFNCSQNDFTR